MLKLTFEKKGNAPKRLLFLGAHSDDIEIGCGGTILRLAEEHPDDLEITWVVFSAIGDRAAEALHSAEAFLSRVSQRQVLLKEFKDGYFPSNVAPIKDVFEELKRTNSPDVIFTHYRDDLHQDHRQLCQLTWNTWRDHLILEYEIPKYDGDLGNPNFFVSLERKVCDQKLDLLMQHFQTQSNKHWFTPDTFDALLRLRGVQCKATGGYAEAFYGRKISY